VSAKSPRGTSVRALLERFRSREDQITIALSLVLGVLVGLVVVAFILLTGRLAARMYPAGSSPWRRVLIPTSGALVTGYLLFRYFPQARGSGIPQTKFALFLDNGYISLRTVLGKFFCCSASLASGIALGREGPAVQIGAGIASVLARRFRLSPQNVKALVPVGCSAALAAAFNTPIAAVLFSLEEILGDLHAPVLGSVVIASATSWMVLHLILGDEPLFHVPPYRLVHPAEFGIYAVLGIVGGLGSVAFVKLLLHLRIWFRRLPKATVWAQPAVGGLMVGLMGWYMPEVLGVGYDYVERVLGGDFPLRTVAVLVVLKIVATAVCYSSGNAGGIFGPSLFIGAMIGGAVGSVAHAWFPVYTANPGAYALIGMGTAFAGIIRTPLTSVIMIFELTRDYSIIVPLMISNLVSFFISRTLQPEPIYEALALQEGVHLPTRLSQPAQSGIRVGDIMEPAESPLPVQLAAASKHPEQPHVHPDQPLSLALERMGAAGVETLPVVSRVDTSEVQGVITLPAILAAFGIEDRNPNDAE
jgi:CIC family chloride channel protein